MADDDLISLRSSSPDGKIKSKDKVYFRGKKSKYGTTLPAGVYYFDSYDVDDDTCFIAVKEKHIPKKAHKKMSFFCYWVDFKYIDVYNDKNKMHVAALKNRLK